LTASSSQPTDHVERRLEDWRRRLIDLSHRNRLIAYKATRATTLEIVAPTLDELLSEPDVGAPWGFFLPPEPDDSDDDEASEAANRLDELLVRSQQRARQRRNREIEVTERNPKRIARILDNLAKRSSTEYQDKALRILYIAAGFLDWHDVQRDKPITSPLVLVPVELRRESTRDPYQMFFVDDEDIVINPSLTEKLRRDASLHVPSDWEWEDKPIRQELAEIREAVAGNGWTVREESAIGLFSFQKYVMYRDLLDNDAQVADHPLVRSIAHGRLLPELQSADSDVPDVAELDTDTDPLIGHELGDYQVISQLGKGGMGAVYEAEDLALRRRVAVKVLLPAFAEDARARARFQREIDHAVAIEHPHVVPVYSAGYEPPHFYIVMRLVPGPDLSKVLQSDGPLPEDRALRLLGQVASALHAVHTRGLVHRDIKPHNVLVWDADGEDEHAILTDFGIAKALDDTRSVTGVAAVGTPAYMAPEVCLGHLATTACDQYSPACMAYQMLAAEPPFAGDASALRAAQIEQPPIPMREAAPAVSATVASAVDRALAKRPEQRFRDVRSFVRAARTAEAAFRRSEEISRVMTQGTRPEEKIGALSSQHGLSDGTISHLTNLNHTEVVRLRRRQARRALVGRRPT